MDAGGLLERDDELTVIEESIAAALEHEGRLLVVAGPAGIGKTSLLAAGVSAARERGATVLTAQGGTLEGDFAFGVVRQLFEAPLAHVHDDDRRSLLEGAAATAAGVVAPDDGVAPQADQAAVIHGLYWLTANLADQSPLVLLVDDLQWCDTPSLLFLTYLARRLEGLSVLVAGAVRTGEPEGEQPLVRELAETSAAVTIRPAPLSPQAVARLVADRLGQPDAAFSDACHTATGGVPFLVRELIRALADDEVEPRAETREQVLGAGPRTVAHATIMRMARLSQPAVTVAEAVAVLDRHARHDRVAALAQLDGEELVSALDTLGAMEILASSPHVRFTHPLVQRAIYDGIPAAQRAAAHRRAAELLQRDGAPPEEVASHLQLSAPSGERETVERLRVAAARAAARGAPGSAVAYLRRANEEGAPVPPDEQALVLDELGHVEAMIGDPNAQTTLEAALALSDDPRQRAALAYDLAELAVLRGDWTGLEQYLDRAVAELEDRDDDLAARIEAGRASAAAYHPRSARRFDEHLPRVRQLLSADVPGVRNLAVRTAAVFAVRGIHLDEVVPLVDQGLDGGRFVVDEGPASQTVLQGLWALICVDELARADQATSEIDALAHQRGSPIGVMMTAFLRSYLAVQRGQLRTAEPDLRTAMDIAVESGLVFAIPSFLHFGLDALLERADLASVAEFAFTTELAPATAESMSGGLLDVARARLRLQRGERDLAVEELRRAGALFEEIRVRNPLVSLWRSPLALALPASARDEAQALAGSELADAMDLGLVRAQGIARRTLGMLEGGREGIGQLEESARLLDRCPSVLERARTLVEWGAALRRGDHRVDARERLRAGLDLAEQSGAERLAARAVEELQIAGARPRRRSLSGPQSLTASEERVARMAANGMTNREIAEELFVTAKTVENQLGAVFRKLEVSSRRDLGGALNG